MDAYDIFKTLAAGAKFNLKRFQSDAERFSVSSIIHIENYFSTVYLINVSKRKNYNFLSILLLLLFSNKLILPKFLYFLAYERNFCPLN